MAVVLFILRLLGWVLLAVLVLLLIALFLPLGVRFSYRPGNLQVKARYGPLAFTLWPRGGAEKPAAKPQPKPPETAPAPPVSKTEGEKASVTVTVKPDAPPASKPAEPLQMPPEPAKSDAPPHKAEHSEKSEPPASAPQKGSLPFGISDRIDAAMQLLSDDPMAFAKCMLGHTGWLGKQLLRAIRVEHLDIFWTVTADEAAATAELYGAEMALANNLLAFVQQYVRLQSDRLWLEPDFTGQRTGERNISFCLTSCAAVLLWLVIRLLRRLWKDPRLQPAVKS